MNSSQGRINYHLSLKTEPVKLYGGHTVHFRAKCLANREKERKTSSKKQSEKKTKKLQTGNRKTF